MRTLGLDTSSTSTGAALLDDGELVWGALWKRPRGASALDALGGFQAWLARHISYGDMADKVSGARLASLQRPDRALIEFDMVVRGVKTVRALARYEGVAACTCQQMDIPLKEITPSSARKRGLGNGGLSKEAAAERVHEMFPWFDWSEDKGHDISDAVVLGLSAFHQWDD